MPTLQQIGATVTAGLLVHSTSVLLFGWAMKRRSVHIAPRCEARPRNVIYNPNPSHSSQDRGNPFLGWVPWVLKLSYEEMLKGVPGTGTRHGGLSGSLLRVNMDDVVMLRFHSYGLRVTTLGMFIYTLIILPLYWSAGCTDATDEDATDQAIKDHCTGLTNYDWTTLANIEPEIELGKIQFVGLSIRLYVVVFASWCVTWYACRELKQEWKDILAMRRFYYLERDHWRARQEDDQQGSIRTSAQLRRSNSRYQKKVASMWTPSNSRHNLEKMNSEASTNIHSNHDHDNNNNTDVKEPNYLTDRDPWIPHPEYPDTPPSVALWSVLVGKIPSKPKTHGYQRDEHDEDEESPNSAHSNREWQLSVTSAFFDHCIPNQPGFSSSVAAVTILPNAIELAAAWRKWYVAASRLRRLRFIRKQIRLKRHYDIGDDDEQNNNHNNEPSSDPFSAQFSMADASRQRRGVPSSRVTMSVVENVQNRRMLGSAMDDDVEELFLEALDFGPEQTAVYIREFAQSASPCCPNGCFEGAVTGARIDELLELEQMAVEDVQAANDALEMARMNAVMDDSLKEANEGKTHARLNNSYSREDAASTDGGSEETKEQELYKKYRRSSATAANRQPSILKTSALTDHRQASVLKTSALTDALTDLPVDLTAVTKIVKSDTIQNLMGKDASVPNENGTTDVDSSGKHLLEDSLLKKRSNPKDKNAPDEEDVKASTCRRGGIMARSQSSPVVNNLAGLPGASRRFFPEGRSECGFLPKIVDEESPDNTQSDELGEEHAPLDHVSVASSHSAQAEPTEKDAEVISPTLEETVDSAQAEKHADLISPPLVETIDSTQTEKDEEGIDPPLVEAIDDDGDNQLEETAAVEEPRREKHVRVESHSSMGSKRMLRGSSARQSQSQAYDPLDAWALVDAMAMNSQDCEAPGQDSSDRDSRVMSAGNWELSSVTEFLKTLLTGVKKFLRWTTSKSNEAVNEAVDIVAADSTYAVVTFTSRQAAVAARKVLADGRGSNRWMQLDTLPIPPLADAAACDPITCRGCCRPVTLSINDRQKTWRWYISLAALFTIYVFYTIPLTTVAALANDENLTELFPGLSESSFLNSAVLSSLFAALIWAGFFAICPVIFKTIANVGSNANSTVEAEFSALKYFWWFMVVSAFSGTSLQRMFLEGFNDGISIGKEFQQVMRTIASTIPTQVSASWINWIIVKTSVTAPLSYMLQVNTYLLDWAQLKCCARAVKGGGPGGPLPFRIYVDSGVVLLCLFSLAPAAPLVAPFAFLYFLLSTPMLRRNVIFMYRPKFDAGGVRFPFLFEMCISSMFVGQLLLATMMGLKKSLGPCVCACLGFVPTYLFRENMRSRYLRAFNDVGLLQTSLLDGWDTAAPESFDTREERRKWIVDCHRAAYVPVCMASTLTDEVLTAEPAVVVPTMEEADPNNLDKSFSSVQSELTSARDMSMSMADYSMRESRRMSASQYGASLRRASLMLSPTALGIVNEWNDEVGPAKPSWSGSDDDMGKRISSSSWSGELARRRRSTWSDDETEKRKST